MPSNSQYSLGTTSAAFDFDVPSGATCRMKFVDIQDLIAAGVVDSVDQLTALVQTEHVDRVKKGKKSRNLAPAPGAAGASTLSGLAPEARQVLEIMRDKSRWHKLETLVNSVVVQCVIAPHVLPIPEQELSGGGVPEGYQRPEAGTGKLYVDEVALVDRLAVFAEAMKPLLQGQATMQPFRQGPQTPLAGLADEPGVPDATQPSAGSL